MANVLVIGAGPAGLMAAETLARAGHEVTVATAEATPGSKFLLAGRGGLNLTHSEDLAAFLGRYGPAESWLAGPIRNFTPDNLRAWAAAMGQPTMVGSSGRIFPEAFRATELLRAWLQELERLGVKLERRHEWLGFDAASGPGPTAQNFKAIFRCSEAKPTQTNSRKTELRTVQADALVLALGGASYGRTGSNGSWVSSLVAAGVEVAELLPTNCGYRVPWTDGFRVKYAGVPLKNIEVRAGEKRVRGDGMVTDSGIEGGPIYGLSNELHAMGEDAVLTFDLAPDLRLEALIQRLEKSKPGLGLNKLLKRSCKLAPVAISLLRECTSNQIPRAPQALAALVKGAELTLGSPMPMDRAISSRGGIVQAELDAGFMLRELPGVFVAGEMLDWTAPTGGYLLQACFATGRAAGQGAADWLA